MPTCNTSWGLIRFRHPDEDDAESMATACAQSIARRHNWRLATVRRDGAAADGTAYFAVTFLWLPYDSTMSARREGPICAEGYIYVEAAHHGLRTR